MLLKLLFNIFPLRTGLHAHNEGRSLISAASTLLSPHVFPFASILARISDFSTLPTLERGRSSQTSICFGVLTLPIRCLTKLDTAATSTVRPALGCTTAT